MRYNNIYFIVWYYIRICKYIKIENNLFCFLVGKNILNGVIKFVMYFVKILILVWFCKVFCIIM